MATGTEPVTEVVDLALTPLRELNQRLHDVATAGEGPRHWRVVNPRVIASQMRRCCSSSLRNSS